MSLTSKILVGMLLGIVLGVVLNLLLGASPDSPTTSAAASQWLQVFIINGVLDALGQIFVASLKLLVVPLVFVSLVCGSASLGGNSRMGALATKTLLLYLLTTAIAISLAMFIAVIVQPGVI